VTSFVGMKKCKPQMSKFFSYMKGKRHSTPTTKRVQGMQKLFTQKARLLDEQDEICEGKRRWVRRGGEDTAQSNYWVMMTSIN